MNDKISEIENETFSKEEANLQLLPENEELLEEKHVYLIDCEGGDLKICKRNSTSLDNSIDITNLYDEPFKTNELIMNIPGDALSIFMTEAKYFKSREIFDESIEPKKHRQCEGEMIEKISIEEALYYFCSVEISANMEYFRPEKIEKYLGYSIDIDLYLSWKKEQTVLKQKAKTIEELKVIKTEKSYLFYDEKIKTFEKEIHSKLLYKLMTEIFGENDQTNVDDDESGHYMITNFRVLTCDGNYRIASACNGKYYLSFNFLN